MVIENLPKNKQNEGNKNKLQWNLSELAIVNYEYTHLELFPTTIYAIY